MIIFSSSLPFHASVLTALLSWRLSAVASGSARSAETSSHLRWSTTATVRTSPSLRISHLLTEGYVRLAVIHIPVHDALQQWSLVVLFLWSFLCLRREFPNWFTQSLSPIKVLICRKTKFLYIIWSVFNMQRCERLLLRMFCNDFSTDFQQPASPSVSYWKNTYQQWHKTFLLILC